MAFGGLYEDEWQQALGTITGHYCTLLSCCLLLNACCDFMAQARHYHRTPLKITFRQPGGTWLAYSDWMEMFKGKNIKLNMCGRHRNVMPCI